MEKNFPFINLSFFDKIYDKLVLSVTRKLDSGQIFKSIMVLSFHILSFVILIGGIVGFFMVMFKGEYAYLRYDVSFGKIIQFLIGLPICLFVSWYGYSLVRKRAVQLYNEEFESILIFHFKRCVPKGIIIYGELVTLALLTAAVINLIAPKLGFGLIFQEMFEIPPFGGAVLTSIVLVFYGLGVLVAAYAIKEIYMYLYKLAISILNPLLVFTVTAGLAFAFTSPLWSFGAGNHIIPAIFVGIVLLYIFFMLLKRHVFKQWHEK